jgi:hypothetical protein
VCGLCVTLGTRTLVCGAEWAYTESERNLSGFLSRPDPESPKIRPFYRLRKPPPGRFYPDTESGGTVTRPEIFENFIACSTTRP